MRIRGALVATFVASLVAAAPASAGTTPEVFIFNNGPEGALNGLQVVATGAPGCADSPYCAANDKQFGMNGFVVGGGPYADCPHVFHYHGVLFGEPDPAPDGCGWGPLLVYLQQSREVEAISDAITYEARAGLESDPDKAKKWIVFSERTLAKLPDNPLVEKAEKLDHQAIKAIKHEKYSKLGGKLEKAVAVKQDYFDSLVNVPAT